LYKLKDRETPLLFPELFPLGGGLNENNRWMKLSKLMPWDELDEVYSQYFSSSMGRPAKDSRLMIGLLVAKHIKRISDEIVVEEFMESPYIQAFCGHEMFVTDEAVMDPSLLSKQRKRLGKEFFETFETEVLNVLVENKIIRPKDHMLDATVLPANIEYPTDVKLVNRCREWLVKTISVMRRAFKIKEKVRTYARTARLVYTNFQRKRRKTKKFIRKAHKQTLQFTKRNIGQLMALLETYTQRLGKKKREFVLKRLAVVLEIYRQQWTMWKQKSHQMKDRIVSLHLPHIRPMVRGKDGRDVEFGPKVLLSWVNGFCFLDHFSFSAYNEAEHAEESLKKYEERFGKLPKVSIGDGIFGNRTNRQKLKELGIRNAFKPLGRPLVRTKAQKAWMKGKLKLRNGHMEGIIGHVKKHFGLDRINYRIDGGEEIWTRMGLLGMNLSTALKRI